jgi:hypothetical protein
MSKRKVIAIIVFGTALATAPLASAQTAPQQGGHTNPPQHTNPDETVTDETGTTPDVNGVPHATTTTTGDTDRVGEAPPDGTIPAPVVAPPGSTVTRNETDRGGRDGFLRTYGLSLSVGAGVTGFTDSTMRDTTKTGGLWDVRVGLMTNRALGVELAYEGGLQAIDSLGLDTDARLLSTELEALGRLNFLTGRWSIQPYAFAGAAWKRYSLENVEINTSDVNDQDDVLEIPLGVGLGYRVRGFLVDVRGSFRPAIDSDLVPKNSEGDAAALHTWAATMRLGYAF